MTFEELSKQLNVSVQTVPNLVQVLSAAFSEIEGGGGGTSHDYSTEERVIGKWTDGKDLYEKVVVSTTTPSANAWNEVALPADISVKMYDAYFVRSTGNLDKFSMYRGDANPVEMLTCNVTNSTAYYRITSQYVTNFSEFRIIIQYTKNTV